VWDSWRKGKSKDRPFVPFWREVEKKGKRSTGERGKGRRERFYPSGGRRKKDIHKKSSCQRTSEQLSSRACSKRGNRERMRRGKDPGPKKKKEPSGSRKGASAF